MFVLTRRKQENGFGLLVFNGNKGDRIRIGSEIELEVLSHQGDRVKLGMSESKEVPIDRDKLH
jgi:sRNA-binding carbon storage regulator CsrA